MTSEEKRERSAFSWTAPKGLLILGLFIVLALISELAIVSFFAYSGLTETATYPLSISPLFHVLPLAVILVLVSSWIYLTKHVTARPYRISTVKVSESRRRRPRRRARSKSTQSFLGQIKKVVNKINDSLFSSDGGSFVQRRLSFSSVALEMIVTVLAVFLVSIILLSVLVYPNLFTDFAEGLYGANTALHEFVLGIAKALKGMVEASGPINDFFRGIAPGFSSAFGGTTSAVTPQLTSVDILWRYVFCQNAAAWISAVFALAYVRYFCKTCRRI
jgi:hypothetical protein